MSADTNDAADATQPAPLASVHDLAIRVGAKDETDPKLALALRLASGRFRDQTFNPISEATDTIRLDSDGERILMLPVRPVSCVESVTINGEECRDYSWSATGAVRFSKPLPVGYGTVEITYTHGYAAIPDGIQDVVIEQAAAMYSLTPGIVGYTTGSETRTYSTAMSVGTTAQWAAMVARYRLDGQP